MIARDAFEHLGAIPWRAHGERPSTRWSSQQIDARRMASTIPPPPDDMEEALGDLETFLHADHRACPPDPAQPCSPSNRPAACGAPPSLRITAPRFVRTRWRGTGRRASPAQARSLTLFCLPPEARPLASQWINERRPRQAEGHNRGELRLPLRAGVGRSFAARTALPQRRLCRLTAVTMCAGLVRPART